MSGGLLFLPYQTVTVLNDEEKDEFMVMLMEALSKPIEDRRSVKRVGTWHGVDIWEVSGTPLRPPSVQTHRKRMGYEYRDRFGTLVWHTVPVDPRKPQNLLPLVEPTKPVKSWRMTAP